MQERAKTLGELLKTRIQPYVDGHKADFRILMKDECARLANHAFGAPILHVIGCAPFYSANKHEPFRMSCLLK